jgi:hypothetical protein
MVSGAKRLQASRVSGAERRAIAEYLTGKKIGYDVAGASVGRCASNPKFNFYSGPVSYFDFGNSPILVTNANRKDLIVIGQKSGVGYAMDPDQQGKTIWQYRAGRGSSLGGMEWGSAADRQKRTFRFQASICRTPEGFMR